VAIRTRMLGHLDIIAAELGAQVADRLGMTGQADTITPARAPKDLPASPALSIIGNAKATLVGRTVAVLVTDGSDGSLVEALRAALTAEGASLMVIAPKVGGVKGADGTMIAADAALSGAPSCLWDAVVAAPAAIDRAALSDVGAACDWVRDAFGHLKVIGVAGAGAALVKKAGLDRDDGVVDVTVAEIVGFVEAAKQGRLWDREPSLRD